MRLDLHIHSHFSPDSKMSVEDIIRRAHEVGLDGIAITDHNSLESFFAASQLVDDLGIELTIVPGAEISTSEGHLITLGITRLAPSGLSALETIEHAHDNGGIAIAPHPFALFRQGIRNLQGKQLDAIEVFNSRNSFGFSNYLATRSAAKLNLGVTGGSDAHKLETIGRGYTELLDGTGVRTKEILHAIAHRRSRAKGEVRMWSVGYLLNDRAGDRRYSK
jgi:predicted metal-dependent phosphoesterase TrpH